MSNTITEQLNASIESHRMRHIENLVNKFIARRTEIKEFLEFEYKGKSYNAFNSGSYAKKTAINSKFDLDLVFPVRYNTFSTIESMFDKVHDVLMAEYSSVATVRKQKVSIGIIFHPDEDGDTISIDVVPGRETSQEDFPKSGSLNIYFNEDLWGNQKGTYTKTNIDAQIEHIKGEDKARNIIRLLKIWKNAKQESFKSFFLELFTLKAFESQEVKGSIWEQLKSVLIYMRDNVTKESFSLIDPGNTSNDLIKLLSSQDRLRFQSLVKNMIDRIEENNSNTSFYFPVNEEFIEEKDVKYETKDGKEFSAPKPNQRYGLQ